VATIKKLSKLFSALGEQSLHRAAEIAAEIAQDEEKKGHRGAARLLRGYLQTNGAHGAVGLNGGGGQPAFGRLISEGLSPQQPSVPLAEVTLRRSARTELENVVREWRSQPQLQAAGIPRRTRLLFHGPPGCGKSLTAKALGKELFLPTYIVRFDGVIGAYLGQTAIHLRELFRFAERNPCVLMFDEVDALAKIRGSPMDVGELDRIVIAFMQELEHSRPAGLVIATSNLPRQLDPALWRRFDLILQFPAPTRRELAPFATSVLARYKLPGSANLRSQALASKSYAEAERVIEQAARTRILTQAGQNHATKRQNRST